MRAPGAVRLLGGELRGRPVRVPPGARPSEGRVREALFSIWAERIPGARFLDLFAGSGAVALEALSRGAATAVAIDGAGPAIAAVRDNARALGLASRCQVVRADLGHEVDRLAQRMGRFDLVFADPPYGFAEWAELLRLARDCWTEPGRSRWSTPGAPTCRAETGRSRCETGGTTGRAASASTAPRPVTRPRSAALPSG